MKIEKVLLIIFILMISATVYSQTINYSAFEADERFHENLIEADRIRLSNGDHLIKRKELFIDIFKQNVYPQQLVLISPQNEIKAIRSITDTIIFKIHEMNSLPHIFFSDKQGELKFVGLDKSNLSFSTAVTTVKSLNSSSKEPTKINDFAFPLIFFSKDNSLFSVIQTSYQGINISVHAKGGDLLYESNIPTNNPPEDLTATISNEGNVYAMFADGKNVKIHATSYDNKYSYTVESNEKKLLRSRTDLIIDKNENLVFFELKLKKDNHLDTIKYTKLNPELKLIDSRALAVNLFYPPNSVKSSNNQRLLFSSISNIKENEIVLLFEYCTPPPQATPLGEMLTQKSIYQYIRNGAILGIHLDSTYMPLSYKLFPKNTVGHLQFLNSNQLNIITNSKSKKEYLKQNIWSLDTDEIRTETIFQKDKSKHYKFDLSNFVFVNANQALIFGWKRRRLLISW